MSPTELADSAKLAISKPREPVPTVGLWTPRSPVLLPPIPIPGQHDVHTSIQSPVQIFPRRHFGLCTNESGDVYIYGGLTRLKEAGLYHYSIKDNTITPIRYGGNWPGPRHSCTMALVGNDIVVQGGWTEGTRQYDSYLYLLNLGSHKWSRITMSGDTPGNLREPAMAAVGGTIYVFGGYDSWSHKFSDKLWAFDLNAPRTTEPRWELVKPSSQAKPSSRYGITLLPYRGQLIMYGYSHSSIVWSFDPQSKGWSELRCTGDIPPTRVRHVAALLDDVMYVIGGIHDVFLAPWKLEGNLVQVSALKIPEQRWFELRNTDTTPLPRHGHASACLGTKILIFGGDLDGESEEHSIHILDANYINNPNLHAPKRLKEIDIECRATLIPAEEGRVKGSEPEDETETSKRSQIVSHILQYPSKMDSLAQLQRADAQMIVDFLADLAKSTHTFPKSTELSDVQCVLTNPVNDEGGYGFIYKGVFRGQAVCVKAVRAIGSGTRASRMLRAQAGELVLLAHVSHPNVIPLYGAYFSSEEFPRMCIVSPWMENGDLAAYLEKFPNTPKILFACDVAAGLDFLHDMGIIHADLKAANVLVSLSQRAILADFGVAAILHTNVGTTTAADFAGTAYWMAPELLIADENPTPAKESDMWGFACVCYEMFTGEIPFVNNYQKPVQLVMVFAKGRRITPLRPKKDSDPLSVDGESWVPLAERCWNYDPGERPTAAEALQFLTNLNVRDDRPPLDEELATFKAIKDGRVKADIDYSRALSIVQNK